MQGGCFWCVEPRTTLWTSCQWQSTCLGMNKARQRILQRDHWLHRYHCTHHIKNLGLGEDPWLPQKTRLESNQRSNCCANSEAKEGLQGPQLLHSWTDTSWHGLRKHECSWSAIYLVRVLQDCTLWNSQPWSAAQTRGKIGPISAWTIATCWTHNKVYIIVSSNIWKIGYLLNTLFFII